MRKYFGWIVLAAAVYAFVSFGPRPATKKFGVLGIEEGYSE